MEPDFVVIDGWKFRYEHATNGIMLTDVAEDGADELTIESTYTINGESKNVVAIAPDFMHGKTTLTSVNFPATLINLGFREVEPMFKGSYHGEKGDGAVYDNSTLVGEAVGLNREYVFPTDPNTGNPYMVDKNLAWRLTLDVTIDHNKKYSYNNYGSAIVSTLPNSLADDYEKNLQIYLRENCQNMVVKINTKLDLYEYTLPDRKEGEDIQTFKFEMEHDGAGNYQVVIYYEDGTSKMYNITAPADQLVGDFNTLYYSLPEGIHVDVTFEKLITHGLFVGCTSLREINVDDANPVFMSCEHGVLYDERQFYVMRIPEGLPEDGSNRYEIPHTVVKLYPGSVHGVNADVVLHSNPQIGVVQGHEEAVKNVRFFLKLVDEEKVKFDSWNLNKYLAAKYVRTPLGEGKFGTIILPFTPDEDNAIYEKYDFFVLKHGDASSITFSQVDKLVADVPYLYRLKEGVSGGSEDDVITVGSPEENKPFEISSENIINFSSTVSNTDKEWESVGCYYANQIITNSEGETNSYYGVNEGSLVRVKSKFTTRPFRVYYKLKKNATQAPARLNLLFSNGESTQIDPSQIEGWEESVYYDLMGRRVLNPTNGVYIVNGKKVIVK